MSFLNLTFLAPMALLGLAVLAVPIYLHMRHKPRAEVFKFPAMDFLLRAQKKRKRRFKAEQLLLMLLRIGIICLLAFLFAKPFLDDQLGDSSSGGDQPMVLILDDSASMLAGPVNARFFEEARARIGELLQRRGSSATRILIASQPNKYAGLLSADEVAAKLGELKASTASHTLDAAYADAAQLIADEGWPVASIHIFTDGSRSAWRSLPTRKPDGVEVIYSSMRNDLASFANVSISSVLQSPGNNNSVEVTITNSAARAFEGDLSMSGSGISALSHRMRLEPFASTSHYFALPQTVPSRLMLSIPADDFDLDNEVLWVPRPNQRIRILIVDGDTHPEPINNESFFLKNALGFEDSEKQGFEYQVVTPVGFTATAMEHADVVFVLNVDLPASEILTRALAKGKGVFVGMGERMDEESWNVFFSAFQLEMWETKSLANPQALRIGNFDHSFFQPVSEQDWRSYIESVGIRKFRLVSTGRSQAKIPLNLADGSPLLISQETKPGRLMVWTSSMDVDWNTFPLEFGYVPFVRQTAAFLAGKEVSDSFQTLTVDQVIARGLQDSLVLKHCSDAFANLDHADPKPGIYTRVSGSHTEFVSVTLDARELDFKSLASEEGDDSGQEALADLGFRSYLRTDLAPSLQWLLFLALLIETVIAARITLSWGGR